LGKVSILDPKWPPKKPNIQTIKARETKFCMVYDQE